MKAKNILLCSAMLLALCSCKSKKIEEKKSDVNFAGKWNVTSVASAEVKLESSKAFVEFSTENDKWFINGDSGVNTFGKSEVELKDGTVKFSDFPLTKMMGEPEAQAFEDLFIPVLLSSNSYEYKDSVLYLRNAEAKTEIQLKHE